MKMRRRTMGFTVLAGVALVLGAAAGCSNGDGSGEREMGTIALPLSTQGASGAAYRLRDAVFQISSQYSYYGYDYAGEGGGGQGQAITVSSEDDPAAQSIVVDVERGYYYVRLLPGWRLEKVEGETTTDVEATLLSESTQWVYVGARSTSFVEFGFGIGDRAVWFNGKLNIDVRVYESPDELYGSSGAGGEPSTGVGGYSQ
jgi:hypothetical protein